MHVFGRADGNAFVLEQRVGVLISQLVELENSRARMLEAERRLLHRRTAAVLRPDSTFLPAPFGYTADRVSIRLTEQD
jgi:hypothetical protein